MPRILERARTTGLVAAIVAASACGPIDTYTGVVARVTAAVETPPMPNRDDAADDPAIWIHPDDPGASRVLATNKQGGLYVYDLDGQLVGELAVGPINNVDVRSTPDGDFAVASQDERNVILLFSIDRVSGRVDYVGEHPTGIEEPYGICLGAHGQRLQPIVTYKDGTVQVFEIELDRATLPFGAAPVSGAPLPAPVTLIRTLKLDSQLEGCVVDEAHQRLFVGEEARGLWSVDLASADAAPRLVADVNGGSGLIADVEGVTLWRSGDGDGWLVVSAQGANRFVVLDRREGHTPRGVFQVVDGGGSETSPIDGVSETDGLDVVATNLGSGFPRGVLVVQDGENTEPAANQNFKFVDWSAVEVALGLPALPMK